MTILCDFIQILGDNLKTISRTEGDTEVPLDNFKTLHRQASKTALLMLVVRNLAGSATVVINNERVGAITATSGTVFSTQLIAVAGSTLNDGDNEIVLKDVTDPFELKDVICFFHQSA